MRGPPDEHHAVMTFLAAFVVLCTAGVFVGTLTLVSPRASRASATTSRA